MARLFKRKGSNKYWIQIHRPGQGSAQSDRIPTGTSDRAQAQQVLDKMLGERADGVPLRPKAHTVRCADLFELLMDHYDNEGFKSKATALCRLDKHLNPFFGGMYAQAVTAGDVEHYKTSRRKAGAKPATIRRELELLKKAFTLGRRIHKIFPPEIVLPKINNAKQGFFEQIDFERVLEEVEDPDYRDFVLFAYVTGWRSSEMKNLRRRHVDFPNNCVRLDPGTTKNGDARVFPMSDVLREMLERRLAHKGFSDEHVFTCLPLTASMCEAYRPQIEARLTEYLVGKGTDYGMVAAIYADLQAQGFEGAYRTVRMYVGKLRASYNPETRRYELRRQDVRRRPVGDFGKAFATACYKAGVPCITEPWSYVEPKSGKVFSGVRVLRSTRTLHDFRRSAVRNFTSMSVPDKVAMELTGHRTRAVFDRYRIVSKADLDIARDRMNNAQEGMRGRLNSAQGTPQNPADVGTVVGTVKGFRKK